MTQARNDAGGNATTRWFGTQFDRLDPMLQRLHREGGTLGGTIEIRLGAGLAGRFGRSLARSMGLPTDRPSRGFEVEIRHSATAMDWLRRFDNGARMHSRFEPVGCWPRGYWRERTGSVELRLTVDVVDGGWQWRLLGARARGLPIPRFVLPRSDAGKAIRDGRYVFKVEFALPVLGPVLYYGGVLDARVAGTLPGA